MDVHHRDNRGETPSHYAMYHCHCWIEWCRVLEQNGIQIDQIIEEEGGWTKIEGASSSSLEDHGTSRLGGDESMVKERVEEYFEWLHLYYQN